LRAQRDYIIKQLSPHIPYGGFKAINPLIACNLRYDNMVRTAGQNILGRLFVIQRHDITNSHECIYKGDAKYTAVGNMVPIHGK